MKRLMALTAVLFLTIAAPAAADSIAYVKDGNIWLIEPDGSRDFQVTKSGGYSYVSQSDDGTLIGLAGRRIHRIDRISGAVTADFATPVSDSPPGATFEFRGPIDPTISPDGKRIAYGYNAQYRMYDPYCGYPGGCSEGKLVVGTGYSHSDRLTAWDEPGFKQHSGWQWPSWIDNERTLITDPAEILNKQFWVDTVGDESHGQPWFRDDLREIPSKDAEMNRQGTAIAAVEGYGDDTRAIHYWKVDGAPPAEPSSCFYTTVQEGRLSSPSWSPSGDAIVFADGVGLQITSGIDAAGCDASKASSRVLLDGGSSPDWGPADVPVPPHGSGGGGGGGADKAAEPGRAKLAVRVPKGVKLARALRKGVVVAVRTGGPGKVALTARAKGQRVGRGAGRASAAGTARVKLTFTKRGARALRKLRSPRVTLRVAFQPSPGGGAVRRTAVLSLRR